MVLTVAHVIVDAMVHMLLHSVGVLDAFAAAFFLLLWLLHVLLLFMVLLMLLFGAAAHCCCCCMCICFCIGCYVCICLAKYTVFPFAFGDIDIACIVAYAGIASFG